MDPSRPPPPAPEGDPKRPSAALEPYEPPRIVKKRAIARVTQQFSGSGPTAGGLPAGGGG